MAQTGTNTCSICLNLSSNERGGLAIYENAIGVHVEHISTKFVRLQNETKFLGQKQKLGKLMLKIEGAETSVHFYPLCRFQTSIIVLK